MLPSSWRISTVAFWLWLVGGSLWVEASSYSITRWWSYFPENHFRYSKPTPEQEARYQECDRLERMAAFFLSYSPAYACAGLLLFARRGWYVFAVAVAIPVMSWLVQAAQGLGHL